MNYQDVAISDEVIAAVDTGRKIEAIKVLREQTGVGLADAKHVVDRLARERGDQPGPAPVMSEEGGAGSLISMVVLIAVILGVYFYFFAG